MSNVRTRAQYTQIQIRCERDELVLLRDGTEEHVLEQCIVKRSAVLRDLCETSGITDVPITPQAWSLWTRFVTHSTVPHEPEGVGGLAEAARYLADDESLAAIATVLGGRITATGNEAQASSVVSSVVAQLNALPDQIREEACKPPNVPSWTVGTLPEPLLQWCLQARIEQVASPPETAAKDENDSGLFDGSHVVGLPLYAMHSIAMLVGDIDRMRAVGAALPHIANLQSVVVNGEAKRKASYANVIENILVSAAAPLEGERGACLEHRWCMPLPLPATSLHANSLAALQNLSLKNLSLRMAVLQLLDATLPKLTALVRLTMSGIACAEYESESDVPLSTPPPNQSLISTLGRCRSLRYLNIQHVDTLFGEGSEVEDIDWPSLTCLESLTMGHSEVLYGCSNMAHHVIPRLTCLSQLRTLELFDEVLHVPAMEALCTAVPSWPHLRRLALRGVQNLHYIAPLAASKPCMFGASKWGDEALARALVQPLGALSGLEELDLERIGLTPPAVAALTGHLPLLPALSSLCLTSRSRSPAFALVAGLSRLRRLACFGEATAFSGVERPLHDSSAHLTYLSLTFSPVNDSHDLQPLLFRLSSATVLRELTVQSGWSDAVALLPSIPSQLTSLTLINNSTTPLIRTSLPCVPPSQWLAFAHALATLSLLRTLELVFSCSEEGADERRHLLAALSGVSALEHLRIHTPLDIGCHRCSFFSRSLHVEGTPGADASTLPRALSLLPCCLRSLSIEVAICLNVCWGSVFSSLQAQTQLTSLQLGAWGPYQAPCGPLVTCLRQLRGLKHLSLDALDVNLEEEALASAVQLLGSLTSLSVYQRGLHVSTLCPGDGTTLQWLPARVAMRAE